MVPRALHAPVTDTATDDSAEDVRAAFGLPPADVRALGAVEDELGGLELLDADAPAVAVVVDLVDHPNGTIVHLDVLPGALDTYVALARRMSATV